MLPRHGTLSLSRSMLDEDEVVLVPASRWHGLRAGSGYHEMDPSVASGMLQDLDRRRWLEARPFLAQANLATAGIDRMDDRRVLGLLRECIRAGRLIAVQKGSTAHAEPDVTLQLRRLVKAIEKTTKGRLHHRGRRYKLVTDVDLARVPARNEYVVLPRAVAERTLTEMAAGPDTPSELRTLLVQVRDKLTRDWRPPLQPDGLVMLRREIRISAGPRVDEPAITPSQMRRLMRTGWLELRVVWDDSGVPVQGVPLVLEAGGRQQKHRTNADGRIRLEDVEDACEVSSPREDAVIDRCLGFVRTGAGTLEAISQRTTADGEPPLAIVAIDEHRVRTGETLADIAAQAGLDWRELARFNWGTDVPAEIDERLRDEVGCTRRTLDGHNYLFDDTDTPGIIYIPRPWSWSCQPRQSYCFRVRRPKGLLLVLENEEGLRLPEVVYQVAFDDGSERSGRLGRNGMARVPAPSSGCFAVTYPDEVDLLAKSLAASVRRGLDARNLDQAFRLFTHDRPVVARAVAAYDRYFNDHTGQGLVEDLYQELVEPEALAVCETLMASHGLPTRALLQLAAPLEEV